MTSTGTRLGMLTPSSNTVLEPVTAQMLAALPHATAHFSRFRVTQIALGGEADAQFAPDGMLQAAELLADARCQVIGWSGTSASWLGHAADEVLCRRIEQGCGVPACTSVLALNEALARFGARRIGLVTPYLPDVQARIAANYAAAGIALVAETHWGLQENFSFATVPESRIAAAVRDAARARPDAVVILCTNLRGAALAPGLEAELGIPVFDSVAAVVWKALALAGEDPAALSRWGRLFGRPG